MDDDERVRLVERALAGYPHGPDAPQAAAALARRKAQTCDAIILVEGISDQIAVETLAIRQGRDLEDEGIVVFPAGGAQAMAPFLSEYGPRGKQRKLAGLCDEDAADTLRMALERAGVAGPSEIRELSNFGFHVCVRDLEDELIRAAGTDAVEAAIESQGDLPSLQTFLKQDKWRDRSRTDQLHRFLRSKARRSQRYARILIETVEADVAPEPLRAVLAQF